MAALSRGGDPALAWADGAPLAPRPSSVHLLLAAQTAFHRDGVVHPVAPLDAALLAWLALEGPTPRQRLAALLWPDKAPDAARNSLRQRLFQLRRQVGVDLVTAGTTPALAEGVTHDLADARTVLGGIVLEIGGEFGQWLEQQRQRRRLHWHATLAQAADAAEATRDWHGALARAGELLDMAPLSEDAHRRVIRLHYLAGDRAAALLAFDRCERMLKDEVGAPPSPETLALLATLTARHDAMPMPAPVAVPASVLRPPRLIGRTRELEALRLARSAGHVAALIGEAGLGKTRVLQEVAEGLPGVVVASGRPGDAGVPFATLARLLRTTVADRPPTLAPALRHEVARVLPECDPDLERGTAARGDGQRLRLLQAVRALMAEAGHGTTLIVDDLHFADAASLDLLCSLIDGEAADDNTVSLHWLLAWRPAEAGSPLQALQDRLSESARLAPVALSPLDLAGLAELVDSLGLKELDGRALAPGLLQRTGGNPLFVLETLKQAWVERGLGRLAEGAALPRPQSVGRLIERRLSQLSPGALALARVASVAGVDFSVELAEVVLQAGAMQFADALNELEAAQVMRGTVFAHDLVFDAVRAGVPQAIAQLTHARVAAWLEPRSAEPARIAMHWRASGQDARAVPWLARAADGALRALRPREAIGFLDQQSDIEAAMSERASAFASGLEALRLFSETDNEPDPMAARVARLEALADHDGQRCELLIQRANAALIRGDGAEAVPTGEAALALAIKGGDPSAIARSRRVLGSCLAIVDRLDEAARHLEAALAWLDVHADDAGRGEAHGDLGIIYDNLGRPADALPHHRQAYALCVQAGRVTDAALASGNLACNRMDAGDLVEAEEALVLAQQWVAANEGQSSQQGMSMLMRAWTLAHLGRYREALAQAELGELAMQRSQAGYHARARMRLAQLWWHLGQWARVQPLLDELAPLAETSLPLQAQHATLQLHAAAQGLGGRAATSQARQTIDTLIETLSDGQRPDLLLLLQTERASVLPPDAALAELDAVTRAARRIGHTGAELAALARAAAAALAHDPGEAARAARAALALQARDLRSTTLLPAEPWLHIGRALGPVDAPRAEAVLREGAAWLQRTAREQVPEPFRESFLHRNPVNAALLAEAARLPRRQAD